MQVKGTTVTAGSVATTVLVAVNGTGHPLGRGGDVFEAVWIQGPARVAPDIVDRCDGTYEIRVRLRIVGKYTWKLRLQWDANHGLDERLDPEWGEPVLVARSDWLKHPWHVTVTPTTPMVLPLCSGDSKSQYVNVPTTRGKVGSLYKAAVTKHPHEAFGLANIDETWVDRWKPVACRFDDEDLTTRRLVLKEQQTEFRSHLRGKTIAFVGDSTIRILYANFLRIALGVHIRSGNEKRHHCHGAYIAQINVTAPEDLDLVCVHEDIITSDDDDKIVVLYGFTSFVNCKETTAANHPNLLEQCERASGTVGGLDQTLRGVLAHAAVVVANIGAHVCVQCLSFSQSRRAAKADHSCRFNNFFDTINIATQVTGRGGVPACVKATRRWLPVVVDLSPGAVRYLVDSLPVPYSTVEHVGEDLKAGIGIRKGTNARVKACNDIQKTLVSGDWTWISGRFDAAWLAPEWHDAAVHYSPSPVVLTLRHAIFNDLLN